MVDLVGTCPKDFWQEWIAEGDAAGEPETGETWGWYTRHSRAAMIRPGDRFYVVAWYRLRGFAIVVSVGRTGDGGWIIERRGGAVACTINEFIPGFRGLRDRWWDSDAEVPFSDWKTKGAG